MKFFLIALSLCATSPVLLASDYNESFDDRFDNSQKQFLYSAIQKAYTGMFADRKVFDCVYQNAKFEQVDNEALLKFYTQELLDRTKGRMWQMQFGLFESFVKYNQDLPDIHIAYFNDAKTFASGYANLGKVNTAKTSDGKLRWYGKFEVTINAAQLQGEQSMASWAGLIAHEMLHNLSNAHPSPDAVGMEKAYTRDLVINALQSCVQAQAAGYPTQHAPEKRCGGRVPQ